MAYQETTKTSYGKNIGNSFKGIFVGIGLILVATILIFWNENRAIKTYKALNRTQDACVELPSLATVDPAFNGKTVHCTGIATTNETLSDPIFGVDINAISLSRQVEYYQVVEHSSSTTKDKIGGGTETTTTYTYQNEWVSEPQNSAKFKDPEHQSDNFVFQVVEERDWQASVVNFGAYLLPPFAVSSIYGDAAPVVNMSDETKAQWNKAILTSLGLSDTIQANYVSVDNNVVYFGSTPDTPHVGDVRVTFTYVPTDQEISLIADVDGNTFQRHADKNGKMVSSVRMGALTADEMFESMQQGNKALTWALRIILLILIIAGFRSVVKILPTLLKVLPFLGKGVDKILGFACTIIGFAWTLLFIAIAWIAVRPVLAISLLVVVIALIVWLKLRSKSAEPTETVEQQ